MRMSDVVRLVNLQPGLTVYAYRLYVPYCGENQCVYDAFRRAARNGLVKTGPNPRRRNSVVYYPVD